MFEKNVFESDLTLRQSEEVIEINSSSEESQQSQGSEESRSSPSGDSDGENAYEEVNFDNKAINFGMSSLKVYYYH